MSGISRRQFLATLATAGVAATAGSSWFTDRLFAMAQEGTLHVPRGPGLQTWVPSLCRLCPAACGIRVRLVDGLPVGLEGDHTNPASAGGLCPAGFAGLQELVHPDRVRTPLRRAGPRGSGRWTAISWDQAIEEMATSLRRLREEARPEAFAVLERGDSPLTRFWLERGLRAYGSPNLILDEAQETWRAAWAYTAGAARAPVADLTNTDFILSFGHELFETDGHPVWQSKAWGRLRAPAVPQPPTLVYVGPRLSPTAARADLRIAVHPGQEDVLALGLIHILITEDLINRSFLDLWTVGYRGQGQGQGSASTSEGFESFVRHRFAPENVSRRTGIPVSQIFRLGRALGSARRPVALVGPTVLRGESGLETAMAVIALNLAVGSVGRAGGFVAGGSAPLALPAPRDADPVAQRGLRAPRLDGAGSETLSVVEQSPARLLSNLSSGRPYPLGVLLVHGVNPVHEWPGGGAIERALAGTGLVVVMARVPDETSSLADLILPEASSLETWNILPAPHGVPIDYAALQQPAVEPLYESRSFEDMWFELARRIGEPVAGSVPGGDYAEWLPEAAAGLFRAGRGTIAGSASEEDIATFMEARGWKVGGPRTEEAFWAAFRKSASWIDAPGAERTPREILGRGVKHFEFWSAQLLRDAAKLEGAPLAGQTIYTGVNRALSERPPESTTDEAFPLRLLLFDVNTIWQGRTSLTPLMLEMTGFREDIAWDSWVEIHPETALRHGITQGDRVRLESPDGSLVTRARLAPVVPPDAVAMARGLGHRHFGRFARDVGANPVTLVSPVPDRWTGAAPFGARIRLSRVRA